MSKYDDFIELLKEADVMARQDDPRNGPRSQLPQGVTGQPFSPEVFESLEDSTSWSEALDARRSRSFTDGIERDFDEDALAWYLNFHFDPERCGVYLTDVGIDLLADWILRDNVSSPLEVTSEQYCSALQEAAQVLLDHERFHHKAEVAVANLELVSGKRIYVPSRTSRDPFHRQLEEALATAEMIRGDRPRRALERRFEGGASIRERLHLHPMGYREAGNYATRRDFRKGRISLVEALLPLMTSSLGKSHQILSASYDTLFSRNSRVYRVADGSALSRALDESTSLYYRVFRPDEMISALIKNFDYVVVPNAGNGSHTKLESTRHGCLMQSIPRTNPVSRTVMTSIASNLGFRGRRREMYEALGL